MAATARPGRVGSSGARDARGGGSANPIAAGPTASMTASTTSSTDWAERKLAAIDRSRKVCVRRLVAEQVVAAWIERRRPRLEMLARLVEPRWIGALEAVNGLLEVADHEQGSHALVGLARPAEKFIDQPVDDLPLRGVGILRLVDKYMVDLTVELVADPLAHAGLLEEAARPVDEVVEIGHARGPFGARVGQREGLPRAQARRDVGGEFRAALNAQELADELREPAGVILVLGLGLGLARVDFGRAFIGLDDLAKVVQPRGSLDRRQLRATRRLPPHC